MTVIFKCKTDEAYQIKVLSELLTHNLKNGCFVVSENGITLRMFDQPRKTLVDLNLESDRFGLYKFDSKKICLGLNLNHFHKMLKSIKKKDSLQLSIDENSNELSIETIPKENSRITTSFIKIQNIQNLDSDVPSGYGKPIIVVSADFQKMSKELSSIGSTNITIQSRKFSIDFIADADNIMKRKVTLGEYDETDYKEEPTYISTFTTDQISRISKISGLSTSLQIFPGNKDLPLLFRSNVGSLGKISIYIKSKELSDKELEPTSDNSDSDSD